MKSTLLVSRAAAMCLRAPLARQSVVLHSSSSAVLARHTAPAAMSALTAQRRMQYAQSNGKRDQEAFLTQYDPLEVLGLDEECNVEEVDAAFDAKKAKYGASGSSPDSKMLDRVFRAHEILKDPESPYYLKAHSSQTSRQRLQFQLLPKGKRRMIEFQVGILMSLAVFIAFMVVKLMFRPMKKSIRSATR